MKELMKSQDSSGKEKGCDRKLREILDGQSKTIYNQKPLVVVRRRKPDNRIQCAGGATIDGKRANNVEKQNQDSFVIAERVFNTEYQHLFGVFDGHGVAGGHCSTLVKDRFVYYFHQVLQKYLLDEEDKVLAKNGVFKDTQSKITASDKDSNKYKTK